MEALFMTKVCHFVVVYAYLRKTAEERFRVTAPTLMWVEALDLLLEKMKGAGVAFREIRAVSGSGELVWKTQCLLTFHSKGNNTAACTGGRVRWTCWVI